MSSTQTVQEVSTTEDLLAVGQEPQRQSIPRFGTISPGQLTPSDLTVLNKMPWSSEEVNGVVRLQVKNSPQEVTKLALAAALLANEEAGAIRLEVRQEKFFFGLFTSTTLYATRKDKDVQWPAGSLESNLNRLHPGQVSDMIYQWLGSDSYHPWTDAGEQVLGRMVTRRVLDREQVQKRVLKLFTMTSTHYVLPDRTLAGVMPQPGRSLGEAQRTRPQVFRSLIEEVQNGINRHQICDSYD